MRMLNKRTDFIASLAKGLRVIECFGPNSARLSISDVSANTGLDRATARRCLLTLHAEGYADYDGKYFILTPKTLRLGMAALASLPLSQIVQPWLDQLTEQIGESCSVAILDGVDIVYVARAAQKRVMSVGLMPGSRLPAHCTSMGRVLLAAGPDTEIQLTLNASDLSPRTPFSLTDPAEIFARIGEVRKMGYALIDQEVEIGLRAIAVPVFDSRGKTVAALNTGMAATHDKAMEIVDIYLPKLLKVQEGLQRVL